MVSIVSYEHLYLEFCIKFDSFFFKNPCICHWTKKIKMSYLGFLSIPWFLSRIIC
jgi:hypothetical protein